ncbi:hypothetical protein, partial [Tardiphaga sp.]|uniref:hypothetical protein n=1 Tax=Tardiphaga sp. TaxID=1926292 RepID=UPI00352AB444
PRCSRRLMAGGLPQSGAGGSTQIRTFASPFSIPNFCHSLISTWRLVSSPTAYPLNGGNCCTLCENVDLAPAMVTRENVALTSSLPRSARARRQRDGALEVISEHIEAHLVSHQTSSSFQFWLLSCRDDQNFSIEAIMTFSLFGVDRLA